MNEQNFDKIFGDKLNEGIDFQFTEQKWGKMEKNLNAFYTQQGRKRLLAWLLLPCLLMLGLLTWGGWLLNTAQRNISDLTKEVQALRLENHVSIPPLMPLASSWRDSRHVTVYPMKNDTVFHHIIVKRYDTIFQTLVRRVEPQTAMSQANISTRDNKKEYEIRFEKDTKSTDSKANNLNNKNYMFVETLISVENNIEKKQVETTISDSIKVFSQRKIGENINEKSNQQDVLTDKNTMLNDSAKTAIPFVSEVMVLKNTDSISTSTPLDDFSFIMAQLAPRDSINDKNDEKSVENAKKAAVNEEKPLENKENEENIEKALEKQKRPPILKPIKIAGYEWGVLGGIAFMSRPNIVRQNGFSMGARGGILLSERWNIVGETQYLFLSYETDKITPDLDIKIITPPTPNDSLDGVKVKQPYWQYAVGVQYAFSEKRLKPYIGINLLGQSKLKEEFEYEYTNKVTNTPSFVQTSLKEKLFQMPFVRLQLGISYPLFGKINAQIEGSYDVKTGNNSSFKPLWQVKTGILYRF